MLHLPRTRCRVISAYRSSNCASTRLARDPSLLVPLVAWGAGTAAQRVRTATLEQQRGPALKTLARASQFVDVIHVSSRPSCLDVQPPEALATPDPLFAPATRGERGYSQFHHRDRRPRAQSSHPAERWIGGGSPCIADRAYLEISSCNLQRRSDRDRRENRVFQPIARCHAAGLE